MSSYLLGELVMILCSTLYLIHTDPYGKQVQLDFSIRALLYNTTRAYYKCSLNHNLCGLKLFIFGANAAVLATPGPEQVNILRCLTT